MPRYLKHCAHLIIFYAFMIAISYESLQDPNGLSNQKLTAPGLLLLALQVIALLSVPQMLCNIFGLTFYDTFPGEITINPNIKSNNKTASRAINATIARANGTSNGLKPDGDTNLRVCGDLGTLTSGPLGDLKADRNLASCNSNANPAALPAPPVNKFASYPHLCFRVVTRGCFPDLVNNNVRTNLLTCVEAGLVNFSIEVVTDVDIHITTSDPRISQIIVPNDYESSTKARFKARALQYALEPGTSSVQDDDYIVHLDEETIVTRNVIYGIINFVLEGRHAFGQGLITYANIEIVNIFTTLADSFRVSRDLGNIRFSLAALHRPIFGIKGSFVVTRCSAEKDVSFDHGEDGSIAEDCYFSMIAYKKGYTFDFIMGEMYEKSPFTMLDLIKQRKRWLQGIWLVVASSKIPWNTKFFLAISFYAWLSLPLTSISLMGLLTEVPYSYYLKPINALSASSTIYMYLFGLVKSFDLKGHSIGILLLYTVIQLLTVGIYFFAENIVVIWGAFSNKHNFYIVQKEKSPTKAPTSQARETARIADS